MKKNKMMRIAAVLLVVTLLSTCAISGTFAKYITKGEGEGSARVAKWGIEISMQDNLFSSKYKTDDENYEGEYSVVSAVEGDDIVAPGTKNDKAIVAHIEGKPEVAARLYLDLDVTKDIGLLAGEYLDYTTGLDTADKFDLDVDYYPVKWDINFKGTIADHRNMNLSFSDIVGTYLGLNGGVSLTDLADFLDENKDTYQEVSGNTNTYGIGIDKDGRIYVDVPAGKEINGDFTLSWKWDFTQYERTAAYDPMDVDGDDGIDKMYDKADTYLGMQDDQTMEFSFAAAAVQID